MSNASLDPDRPDTRAVPLGRGSAPVTSGRVLVRMFITLLPSQLIGFGLGGALLSATGLLSSDRPGLSFLINAVAGVLAGLALGMFLTPSPARLPGYLAVSTVMGLVIVLVLVGLAQLRMGGALHATVSSLVLGAVVTVVPQALLAWGLWVTKKRPR